MVDVSPSRRVVGVDVGGVTGGTTGIAVLTGSVRPALRWAEAMPRARRGQFVTEEEFFAAVSGGRPDICDAPPDVIAIDAPLTLPPCLRCAPTCEGPGDGCSETTAMQCWSAEVSPVTQRLTEACVAKATAPFRPPLPTMQLGVITARSIALARRLRASSHCAKVLEVYPTGTLHVLGKREPRMAARRTGEPKDKFRHRVLRALEESIDGLDDYVRTLGEPGHVFDALLAAYTGWLYLDDGLQPPDDRVDEDDDGWIWLPRPST